MGPFEGLVVSVQSGNDSIGVQFGPTRERIMPIPHPFSGTTSWIRSMPETNSKYLMQNRFDTGQPEALKTLPISQGNRSSLYGQGLNTYRTLDSGEHDIASSGSASAFLGRRGHFDLRSGANIKSQLSRESQDRTELAPTYKRELLFHAIGAMGDEERLGIVKRWTTAIDETYPQKNGKFVAEHYLQIKNPAGTAPAVLFQSIEGSVYGDSGTELKHFTTAVPLRSQKLWYTTTDAYLRQEIDQNGNFLLEFPPTATVGYELLIPQGGYKSDIGLDREFSVGRDDSLTVTGNLHYQIQENSQWDVAKLFGVAAQDIDLTARGKVYLGAATSDEPFVLGNAFKTWMQNLIEAIRAISYIGNLGAPVENTLNDATFATLESELADLLSVQIFGRKGP